MSDKNKHQTQRKWLDLPPPSFCNGKKKLALFDFDGTLFNSPDRETGEALYQAATGKPWPFDGWWGRLETLMPPVVPDPIPQELLIKEVYDAYKIRKADPEFYNVLMTGRPYKIRHRVQEILRFFDLTFDEEYYRGQPGLSFSQDTFDIKTDIMESRLLHDRLECLEIWEDRPEHIGRFTAFAGKVKYRKSLSRAVVHDVKSKENYEV